MCICPICLDTLSSPIALPCGHVFCRACLVHAIQFTTTRTPACPTCRTALPLTAPDPAIVPPHLQSYVHPPFRRLYVTPDPPPAPQNMSPISAQARAAHLEAENALLRQAVARWRLFADAQLAAAARARTYACTVGAERDVVGRECAALKRKLGDGDADAERPAKRRPEDDGNRHPRAAPSMRGVQSMSRLIPTDILSKSCPPLARRSRTPS